MSPSDPAAPPAGLSAPSAATLDLPPAPAVTSPDGAALWSLRHRITEALEGGHTDVARQLTVSYARLAEHDDVLAHGGHLYTRAICAERAIIHLAGMLSSGLTITPETRLSLSATAILMGQNHLAEGEVYRAAIAQLDASHTDGQATTQATTPEGQ